jgi:PAS domain S-box-containing protein
MSFDTLSLPGTSWKEEDRLEAIDSYEILDTPLEEEFQDMVKLAAERCNAPIALVSIVAKDKQWFKAKVGLDIRETPLAESICRYTIMQHGVLVIPDISKDSRFLNHPLTNGENPVRFYAGATLETPEGLPIGAMCILDNKPRQLTEKEEFTLKALARQVMIQLELRRQLKVKNKGEAKLRESELSYRRLFEAAQDGILILDLETGCIADVNPYLVNLLGFSHSEMVGKTVGEMSPFRDVVSNQAILERLQKERYVRYEDLPLETKDGRHIAVEFVSNVYQVGEKRVIQCNIRDITERKKTDRELDLLNTCVSHLSDLIVVTEAEPLDEPGPKIVFVNEAFEKVTGYTPSETLGRNPRFLQGEKTDPFVLNEIRQALARHEPIHRQIINYKKDGTEYWMDIDIVPIFDAQRKCTHFAAIERDVTETKKLEARSRILVDSNAQGVLFYDKNGGITGANDAFLHLVRRTREELEAGLIDWVALTPPEYEHLDRRALDEIATNGVCTPYEKEYLLKDGSRIPIIIGAASFKDNPDEGVAFVLDIAKQKKSEARFRRLVDSNAQSVFFYHRNGEIADANDSFLKLVGYTREDLEAGRINWINMTPPDYAERELVILKTLDTTGVFGPYEKEFIRKDGSRVPVLLGTAAFEDNPDEGVSFVLDLTERKKLEQQFLRAQRMESIGTLAGGIAHDLNNILAPIMMSIELLKGMSDNPQAAQILATIEASARQGADIVRQVLSFARGMEGERIEIQPKHLLQDLENIIKSTFPKNIQMEFFHPNNIWTILGDPTQVHQILLNLCVNARDAMPTGGRLTVAVENCRLDEHYAAMSAEAKPGRYVQINVTDSGTGMPPDVIDKIFDPFFTTKEIGKGTGLGLSTVMAVVKSHEGIVNVYSEPGKGTTFKVYLPAVETSAEGQKRITQRISVPRGNGETILVIDDEASILTITSQTLQAFGYKVLTATDGAEAVAIYAKHDAEIAVVLTDMMMPVMDGTATIRALARINPAVKIIAASGLNANGTVAKISEPNVKHFLTKPYTAGTLLTTVRAILDEAPKT